MALMGGNGSADPGDAGSTTASGKGGRWPWWKIVLAVMVWPFTLLWWVWQRSSWGRVPKILVTVAVAALFIVYFAMIASMPRTPRTTSMATPGASSSPAPSSPAAPTDPRSQLLKASDFGDRWPLTVPEALVSCRPGDAVVVTVDGKDVAVNGLAMTMYKSMPRIGDSGLWRDATTAGGPKVDIGPIIDIGLDLCQGKRFTPGAVPPPATNTTTLQVPAAAPASNACDAAFKAWEPNGAAIEPSDPLVVATLTECASLAEWRGGLEAHPMALDYQKASEIGPGNIRSDLLILCGTEQSATPVCADAKNLGILG